MLLWDQKEIACEGHGALGFHHRPGQLLPLSPARGCFFLETRTALMGPQWHCHASLIFLTHMFPWELQEPEEEPTLSPLET